MFQTRVTKSIKNTRCNKIPGRQLILFSETADNYRFLCDGREINLKITIVKYLLRFRCLKTLRFKKKYGFLIIRKRFTTSTFLSQNTEMTIK